MLNLQKQTLDHHKHTLIFVLYQKKEIHPKQHLTIE